MKKTVLIVFSLLITVALISWGTIGHKTIATIAEAHLSTAAAANLKMLLGEQSMSAVASWADEVRNHPEYKQTAPWHYADVPLGLGYQEFDKAIKEQGGDNVYGAIVKCEEDIKSTHTTKEEKTIALKFLIHFIGDCHQPMHVSRPDDKGGNTIHVLFEGNNTNLHSLWDSGLINKQAQSIEEMSKNYDKATSQEIKEWQDQPVMQWLYESYLISTQLYKEVDEDHGRLGEAYYDSHIAIVNNRIEKAGIRLAGVLNAILAGKIINDVKVNESNTVTTAVSSKSDRNLPSNEALLHIGEKVKIIGRVFGGKFMPQSGETLLDIGGHYPQQDLTIAIPMDVHYNISIRKLTDQTVTVEGLVVEFRGKPEIKISSVDQLNLVE